MQEKGRCRRVVRCAVDRSSTSAKSTPKICPSDFDWPQFPPTHACEAERLREASARNSSPVRLVPPSTPNSLSIANLTPPLSLLPILSLSLHNSPCLSHSYYSSNSVSLCCYSAFRAILRHSDTCYSRVSLCRSEHPTSRSFYNYNSPPLLVDNTLQNQFHFPIHELDSEVDTIPAVY